MMNKNNNFTFIHVCAAILVIFGHQFDLLGIPPMTILGIDTHGFGVRILFLVSGYLVSGSYLRTKSRRVYLLKRLSRLYPPLIACLILTVLCLYSVSYNKPAYWSSAINYLLSNFRMFPNYYLAGVFTNNPYPNAVNGSLWTLPYELLCYFLLILVADVFVLLSKKKRQLANIFVGVLLAGLMGLNIYKFIYSSSRGVLNAIFYGSNWPDAFHLFFYFFVGTAIRFMNLEKYFSWQAAIIVSILYLGSNGLVRFILMPFAVSCAVMSFGLAEKPLFAKVFKRDVCYGLYLFGFPVQQLLIFLFYSNNIHPSVYSLWILSTVATWILAELSYRFIEAPSTKMFDKLIKKIAPRPDA